MNVLPKSQEKYNYHIRFALTKSDGSNLTYNSFNETELNDIRSCITFNINFEPDILSIDEVKINKILIHYDGVTKIPEFDFGYEFLENSLTGYPAPIVTFELNKEVDSDEFKKSIWTSSISIFPTKMENKGKEPFFAEDHNGYTSIIDEDDLEESISALGDAAIVPPKEFNFPEGMPEYGDYSIAIIDLFEGNNLSGKVIQPQDLDTIEDDESETDREEILEAVKEDGYALEYADEKFKSDREVVLAAVKSNKIALRYVDEKLIKKLKEQGQLCEAV